MFGKFLSDCSLISSAIATSAANTTTINGTTIDMAGYDSAFFVVKFGTAANNNTLHLQQGTDSTPSDAANLTGTLTGVGASDELVWLDIHQPEERYIRIVASRGTSTTIDWGVCVQYNAKSLPCDNTTSGTIYGEQFIRPAEGTA